MKVVVLASVVVVTVAGGDERRWWLRLLAAAAAMARLAGCGDGSRVVMMVGVVSVVLHVVVVVMEVAAVWTRVDPNLLNDFNMATNENGDDGPPTNRGGDLPVPDLRTMEELCQPTLNGRGRLIAPIEIQATNFGLKNDMIQQVQNSCQFHGLQGDDANKHLDKFLHVTQSIKVNGVSDDALRLYLFPHSLTHHATAWFDRFPRNSITTFDQMAKMFLGKYFPPSMVTKLRNEITNFHQRPDESLFKAWECYKLSIDRFPNHNMLPVTQIDTFYNGLTLRHRDTIDVADGGTFMKRNPEKCYDLIENMTAHHNDWDTSAQRSESSSSIASSSDPEIVALKAETAEINKNLMQLLQINQQVQAVTHSYETCGGPHSYNDCLATVGQTQNVYALRAYNQGAYQAPAYQAPGYQAPVHQAPIPQPQVVTTTDLRIRLANCMKMNTASSSGLGTLPSNTITNPKEDLKCITTRSGISNKGPKIPTTSSSPQVVERETEVTKDTAPPTNNGSIKYVQPLVIQVETQILNSEPVVAPVVEPVEAPANDQMEKFFQIFQDLNFNISFADALIHMPKFASTIKSLLTNKEKLFELDECLALVDLGASINPNPLSVWNKLSLPELSPTSNYDAESINRIDVIDIACEEYSQEVLGFNVSGNPTLSAEPIVSTSSPTLTPFRDSDFLLDETDAFLVIDDEQISPEIDDSYYDSEGDILLLEEFLNDDPSSPPLPLQELKVVEQKNEKSSINEPPMVELKDLSPHLEYAFLEGDNNYPS
nr:reverse transcriptase domain-containing protein [Tanacetum cinerariifolium]